MKAHLEINNLDAGVAVRCKNSSSEADGPSNAGNINATQVQKAALGTEIVLHVNDDYRSLCDINRSRFRFRIELDNPAFQVMRRRTRLLRRNRLFTYASNKRGGCCRPNETEYFPSARITAFQGFLFQISFHGTFLVIIRYKFCLTIYKYLYRISPTEPKTKSPTANPAIAVLIVTPRLECLTNLFPF